MGSVSEQKSATWNASTRNLQFNSAKLLFYVSKWNACVTLDFNVLRGVSRH